MKHYLINANHKYNYMLFRIPKNANSTLSGRGIRKKIKYLQVFLARSYISNNQLITQDQYNILLEEKKEYKKYFKYAIVRNPYERLVSCWKNKTTEEYAENYKKHLLTKATGVDDIDYIGRMESLQKDFEIICDIVGMNSFTLPHVNFTKHKHYREYYDKETRQIVEKIYSRDIDLFKYRF